jgi:hypothetical protein
LAQGAQTIVANETDAAGNTGTVSLGFALDAVAPQPPVIINDTVNVNKSVTLNGTSEANSTVTLYEGRSSLGTTTTNGSGGWSFTTGPLANGSHAFTATATDAAGNTSAASETLDPTIGQPSAPTIMSFSPDSGRVGDGITNATILTLTGTADANSTIQVFDGTTQLGITAANDSGGWSFTTGTLTNGSHSFTATENFDGDASTESVALNVMVDTVSPLVTMALASDTGVSSIDKITSNPMLSGSGDANAVVTLKEGTTVLGTTTANATGDWSFTPTGLVQGSQTILASETDAAGNTGAASLTFALDTVSPAPPVITQDAHNKNKTITLSGTAESNSTVTVYDEQTEIGTTTTNGDGEWNYTTGTLKHGFQVLTASATDAADNTSAAPNLPSGYLSELAGIDFARAARATLENSPNSNGTAVSLPAIALLGDYIASSFAKASDSHGVTMVFVEASQTVIQSLLTHPQHT